MARRKLKTEIVDLENALSFAYGELQSLRDEVREIVDNASGTNLEHTSRIQTLTETADSLDSFCDEEPSDVPELQVSYVLAEGRGRRGLSRSARRDNAVNALRAAIDALAELADSDDEDKADAAQELADTLDNHASDAENLEFPGMFG